MNVLLDLDGTLTDPKKGIVGSIQHALRSMGRDAPEESALLMYIGPPLRVIFRELLGEDGDTEQAVVAYRERFVASGMFENSVYPEIPEALKTLRQRGARLFIATSKPQIYAQRILDHFGLSHYFDEVYGSELDGQPAEKVRSHCPCAVGIETAPIAYHHGRGQAPRRRWSYCERCESRRGALGLWIACGTVRRRCRSAS